MIFPRTERRNREIFSGYQRGESVGEMADRYGLSIATVNQVIRVEKHKIAVSVDAFYKEMRELKLDQPS